MNRLQMEVQRLYLPDGPPGTAPDSGAPSLIDGAGQVRAMVLGLHRPADWATLAPLWQGVQAELSLPAPAIAVCGEAGLQLWFSLDQALPAAEAHAFLDALRRRYLPEVASARVACWPQPDAGAPGGWRHASPVPAPLPGGERWSAFVAQDLAAVFAEEPWLELPPSIDGQAQLLARLDNMRAGDFIEAMVLLEQPAGGPVAGGMAPGPAAPTAQAASTAQGAKAASASEESGRASSAVPAGSAKPMACGSDIDIGDPRQFLLRVMNDNTVPMGLRIEAAKALLQAGGASTQR
jgi:hypothetical protein